LSSPTDPQILFSLLDASVDGIHAFDRECRYIAWNRAMERISGVKRADALGKVAFELFPFLKEFGADQHYRDALAGKTIAVKNRPYRVPETSREGFYEGHYSPLILNGEVVGGIGIIHDITDQRRIAGEAREIHQRLSFHVENSPLAVIEWDSEFRVSRWSEAAERLFGWEAHEVVGKKVTEWPFVYVEDVAAVDQVSQRQREGLERRGVIFNRNYTKGGSVLYCEWYNSVLCNERGRLVSVQSLVLDVTARRRAEEERAELLSRERDARKHAEDADRLKDEFLATLSHELRTPLTAVLGWASLMRTGDVPATDFARALEIIERNARSQARLIDDLLDVSRIITGNLHVEMRPLDLASVVELASEAVRPAAKAKGIRLQLEFDSETRMVRGDPTRLRQVVWNLLLNAIKFTPRGGSVSVRVEASESSARLVVSDTGEGINPEFLPYVFDRFRQAQGSISRKQGGLGLGLAVVRHLVELHGGSVNAQSEGPGKGSTFTVDLPIAQNGEEFTHGDAEREAQELRQALASRTRLQGLRVLVVEDDDDSRSLVGMMLKRQGAEVLFAASSSEALGVMATTSFDLLVSDIGMPDEDGYELIRKVRALPHEEGRDVPAIALTGYATARDRERAMSAGYQTHIPKPVEPSELVQAIVELTGREKTEAR
jgi:PAS domain S-box-containing protein